MSVSFEVFLIDMFYISKLTFLICIGLLPAWIEILVIKDFLPQYLI